MGGIVRASPNYPLDVGTRVKVGNRIGIVTKSEMVNAHPCGMVASNHISFTGISRIVYGKKTRIEIYDKPTKPKPISYVAIEVLP